MATEEEVRIIIKAAADQAIGELGKLNSSLGTSQKQTAGVTSKLAGMRTAYYGVIGVLTTLAAVTAKVIKATAEQEAVEAQLVAVLKSTQGAAGLAKDELLGMAEAMQQASIYSDEAIIKSQSLLLTFTKIGREVFPQAEQAILDVSTALGQDLQASTIQIGKALQDPILGMTTLRRVGIQLSEAQQQQVKDFMAVNDVASAQKVILGELSTQFGGQALARAKTLSGQLEILKNNIGDLFEQGAVGDFTKGIVIGLNKVVLIIPLIVSKIKEWYYEFIFALNKISIQAQTTARDIANALGMKDTAKVMTVQLLNMYKTELEVGQKMVQARADVVAAKNKLATYEAVVTAEVRESSQNAQLESEEAFEEKRLAKKQEDTAKMAAWDDAYIQQKIQKYGMDYRAFTSYSGFMMQQLNKNNKAEFIAFKGFAIIEATVNTYKAAVAAYAAMAGIPIVGPALATAAAASAIAMGLRHVQNIAKMQPPKAAAGGYIPGSPGGTHLIAGEGGRGEAILPLENPDAMDKIRGAFSGVTINLSGNIFARDDWPREIVMKIDRELYKLKQDRRSALFS